MPPVGTRLRQERSAGGREVPSRCEGRGGRPSVSVFASHVPVHVFLAILLCAVDRAARPWALASMYICCSATHDTRLDIDAPQTQGQVGSFC